MNDATPAVFKITEVARLAGVSASTLRLWESQGLMDPSRTSHGHREYRNRDVVRAKRIAWFRSECGLNPAAIRVALAVEDGTGGEGTPAAGGPRVSKIGRRLRSLRRDAGRTLDQVAKETGIAASLISTLERTSRGASFRVLHDLAKYYGTTVSMLSDETNTARSLVRAGQWQTWSETTPGVTVQLLAEGPHSMDCHRFVLAPGASSDGAYHHDGEEFLHVLSGGVEIILDGLEIHALSLGDSLYFDSQRKHAWRNTHDGETILLWVNTPPTF